MATTAITINIDNTQLNRVINAMATSGNYQAKLEDGRDNPQTKAQFAKQMLVNYVMNTVKSVEAQTAIDNARTAAVSGVDSQVVIT